MSVVDQRVVLGAGRARRLLTRALLVAFGAIVATAIGWLVCSSPASADELPAAPTGPLTTALVAVPAPAVPALPVPGAPAAGHSDTGLSGIGLPAPSQPSPDPAGSDTGAAGRAAAVRAAAAALGGLTTPPSIPDPHAELGSVTDRMRLLPLPGLPTPASLRMSSLSTSLPMPSLPTPNLGTTDLAGLTGHGAATSVRPDHATAPASQDSAGAPPQVTVLGSGARQQDRASAAGGRVDRVNGDPLSAARSTPTGPGTIPSGSPHRDWPPVQPVGSSDAGVHAPVPTPWSGGAGPVPAVVLGSALSGVGAPRAVLPAVVPGQQPGTSPD